MVGKFYVVKLGTLGGKDFPIELNFVNSKGDLNASYLTRGVKIFKNHNNISQTGYSKEVTKELALQINALFRLYDTIGAVETKNGLIALWK